jgi:hypothetical protein
MSNWTPVPRCGLEVQFANENPSRCGRNPEFTRKEDVFSTCFAATDLGELERKTNRAMPTTT